MNYRKYESLEQIESELSEVNELIAVLKIDVADLRATQQCLLVRRRYWIKNNKDVRKPKVIKDKAYFAEMKRRSRAIQKNRVGQLDGGVK